MTKFKFYILLSTLSLYLFSCKTDEPSTSNEATIVWEKTYDTYNYVIGSDMKKLSDNNYIIAGHNMTDANGWNFWLLKTDQNGNKIWEKEFGSTYLEQIYNLVTTSDGGFVYVGYEARFDKNLSKNYSTGIICRIDQNGDSIWSRNIKCDGIKSIIVNSKNEYVVTSSISPTNSNGNSAQNYFIKFNSSGLLLFDKLENNTENKNDNFNRTIENSVGDYITCGYRYKDNQCDCVVLCFDDYGNVKWQKTYGGFKEDGLSDIKQTPDGGYITVGYTLSKDGDIKTGNKGDVDAWIIKINSVGEIQWEKTFGGSGQDFFKYVKIDTDNNFIVSYTSSSKDFDFKSDNQYKFGLLKIDNNGNVVWKKNIENNTLDSNGNPSMDFKGVFIQETDGAFSLLCSTYDSYYNTNKNKIIKIK
jgi:hypothetical protein